MKPSAQQLFDFDGSFCHILVFDANDPWLIVATELDDNPGTSITSGCRELAAHLQHKLLPDGREFRLLLHHPPIDPDEHGPLGEATYAWVTFGRRSLEAATWRFSEDAYEHVEESEVIRLLGLPPHKLIALRAPEQNRLSEVRDHRIRDEEADTVAERASYEVVALDTLPPRAIPRSCGWGSEGRRRTFPVDQDRCR